MNIVDLERAKALFKYYKGSHYQMAREGDYDEYKKKKISKETETEWLRELQDEFREGMISTPNVLKKTYFYYDYVDVTIQLKDHVGFQFMLEYARQNISSFDTKTMYTYIRIILRSAKSFPTSNLTKEIIRDAVELLKEVQRKPTSISDDYLENGKLPDYLSYETLEKHIKETIAKWSV